MAAKRKSRRVAPRKVWIEWSSDYAEILATHGSMREAKEGAFPDSRISGPYVLVERARER